MLVKSANDRSSSRRPQLSGAGFAAIGLVMFALVTLGVDAGIVLQMVKTLEAQSFPSVSGEIIHSEVLDHGTGKDRTIRADIRYQYSVDGKLWTGDRVHFHGTIAEGLNAAQKLVETNPIGRTVQIFFDPCDPRNSALERSLDGRLMFAPLCILPLNLVVFGALCWVLCRMLGLRSLPLRREGSRWSLLPTNGQPLTVGLIVAGVASISAIVFAFFGGWGESIGEMIATWCVLIGLSLAAYWHTRTLVKRERPVLILDGDSDTVTWPATADTPELSIARSQLLAVEIDDVPRSEVATDSRSEFSIVLRFSDGGGQPTRRVIFKTCRGSEVASVADWVEEWVGLNADSISNQSVPSTAATARPS